MKTSRRNLSRAIVGAAAGVLLGAGSSNGLDLTANRDQPPAVPPKETPKDPLAAANASLQSNTAALAKIKLPEDLEPSFTFHA